MHRDKTAGQAHPERIPVLPIRSTIVFPGGATALQIGFAPNVEALSKHPQGDLVVAMVSTVEDDFPPRVPRGHPVTTTSGPYAARPRPGLRPS